MERAPRSLRTPPQRHLPPERQRAARQRVACLRVSVRPRKRSRHLLLWNELLTVIIFMIFSPFAGATGSLICASITIIAPPHRICKGGAKFFLTRRRRTVLPQSELDIPHAWLPRDFWLEAWEKDAIRPSRALAY